MGRKPPFADGLDDGLRR